MLYRLFQVTRRLTFGSDFCNFSKGCQHILDLGLQSQQQVTFRYDGKMGIVTLVRLSLTHLLSIFLESILYEYMLNSGADTNCERNQKIVGMAGN